MTQTQPDDPNRTVNPVSFANSVGQLLDLLRQPASGGTGTTVGPLSGLDSITQVQSPLTPETSTPTDTQAASAAPSNTPDTGSSNPLPGSNYSIGQGYGAGNSHDKGGHPGIDLDVPVGTTAVAAISGKVTQAGLTDPGGYGNLVEIQGANGIKIRYGHLSYVGAKVGQTVKAGQPIGKTGGQAGAPGSGNSTGPHLHFEVDLPQGGTTDPTPYLAGGAQVVKGQNVPDLSASQATPTPADPRDAGDTAGNRLTGALIGQDPGSALQQAAPEIPAQGQQGQAPTGQNAAPTSMDAYFSKVLAGIGAPVTQQNLAFMRAWMQAEGGDATNPFNTTQGAPGATTFNSVGVKRYPNQEIGAAATIQTLVNGRYGNIIAALKSGNNARAAAAALTNSPWGTGSLVQKILGS